MEAARHIKRAGSEKEIKDIANYIEGNIWHQKKSTVLGCSLCGLEFAFPYAAGDSFLYNILYDSSNLHDEFWKWDFKVAFNALQEREKKDLKILDIGAGSGHFISRVASTITRPEYCYAIEYSDVCREELAKLRIHTNKNLSEITEKKSFFDAVCLFQSLEHMDDLKNKLFEIDMLAQNDGLIIITVPNNRQRSFYDKCGIHEDVPPIHISRFCFQTFKKISEHMQWELLYHFFEPISATAKLKRFIYFASTKDLAFQKIKTKTQRSSVPIRQLAKGSYAAALCAKNTVNIVRLLMGRNLGTSQIAIFEKTGSGSGSSR